MGNILDHFDELSTVNDRLAVIVNTFENGKKAAFARKVDISPQAAQEILSGRRSEPSFKVLVKILTSYPQVRSEWLVLGKGEMLKAAWEDYMWSSEFQGLYVSPETLREKAQEYNEVDKRLEEQEATIKEIAESIAESASPEITKRIQNALTRINDTSGTVLMGRILSGPSEHDSVVAKPLNRHKNESE